MGTVRLNPMNGVSYHVEYVCNYQCCRQRIFGDPGEHAHLRKGRESLFGSLSFLPTWPGLCAGQTINIKKPPRYNWRAGRVSVPQATVQQTVALTLTQGGTDLNFTSPSARCLSRRWNRCSWRQWRRWRTRSTVKGWIWPSTLASTALLLRPVWAPIRRPRRRRFSFHRYRHASDTMGAPRDRQRYAVLSPRLNGASVQALSGLFNSQSKLADQYGSGLMVDAIGFNVSMDQNVQTHTNGSQPIGPTANAVNGAGNPAARSRSTVRRSREQSRAGPRSLSAA